MTKHLSLVASGHPLASASSQRARLAQLPIAPFASTIVAGAVDVLQMNVGKRCNQTCAHCHVDAGPDRVEVMTDAVVDACLAVLERRRRPIHTLDVTGGAPELHPRFREIVTRGAAVAKRVIDRANLTALTDDVIAHLAKHRVSIVASLPSWEPGRTDAQRGDGVFDRSIAALRKLNDAGYGDGELELTLMSNPTGAFLPPAQAVVEDDFRRHLGALGVRFTSALVLTNMPIARFLAWLDASGNTERYMSKLASAFNAQALARLMCRNTLSVGWDGRLYDCDFNQMLELPLASSSPRTIFDVAAAATDDDGAGDGLTGRAVTTGAHCYGCTAGQGSSCAGAIAPG